MTNIHQTPLTTIGLLCDFVPIGCRRVVRFPMFTFSLSGQWFLLHRYQLTQSGQSGTAGGS